MRGKYSVKVGPVMIHFFARLGEDGAFYFKNKAEVDRFFEKVNAAMVTHGVKKEDLFFDIA